MRSELPNLGELRDLRTKIELCGLRGVRYDGVPIKFDDARITSVARMYK